MRGPVKHSLPRARLTPARTGGKVHIPNLRTTASPLLSLEIQLNCRPGPQPLMVPIKGKPHLRPALPHNIIGNNSILRPLSSFPAVSSEENFEGKFWLHNKKLCGVGPGPVNADVMASQIIESNQFTLFTIKDGYFQTTDV